MEVGRDAATALVTAPQRSFEEFFDTHRRKITFAVWLVTRDQAEAEEIAQDAFLAVWQRWERVSALEDPGGYLFRAAMNLALKRRRTAVRAAKHVVHSRPPPDEADVIAGNDVVYRSVGHLTRAQRAAVVVVDVLGYSSVEAARFLHMRPSTVRVHLSRAHAALRRSMEDQDDS
jgi:RNA polymerase sigma factor (sigma-70 family)